METVGNYAQLYASLGQENGISRLDFLKILLFRATLLIEQSNDADAKSCIRACEVILQMRHPSIIDLETAKTAFLAYGDEEILGPPGLEYYHAMPILLALAVSEYAITNSSSAFQHSCDQYETMLQVASALLDTRELYEIDMGEVSQHLTASQTENTPFKLFARFLHGEV